MIKYIYIKATKLIERKMREIRCFAFKKLQVSYQNKYLRIHLQGGLCNKLHCLFSACDIALKQESYLVEPYFGWNSKILFSDIYDIDHFNDVMSKYYNGKCLMIPKKSVPKNKLSTWKVLDNYIDLWDYSEKELDKERESEEIERKSMKLIVLEALKLKTDYEEIVKRYTSKELSAAIQIRTESDWQKFAKDKEPFHNNESILVGLDKLMNMICAMKIPKDIFFTSGENHLEIRNYLDNLNYNSSYFYSSEFEYEINAGINFEICSKADLFIGNSRSSYSNLISLKRASLLEMDQSFIYNYGGKIYRRIDKGLQTNSLLSISKKTTII